MPAIAKSALAHQAEFYWHLGDFRAINRFDEDYIREQHAAGPAALSITDYLQGAWQDFIDNQLKPFGNLPLYLVFGNHELKYPMTKEHLLTSFSFWLNAPAIREGRIKDGDEAVQAYYHWMQDGIDFITLDNSAGIFEPAQLKWIRRRLNADASDAAFRAVVIAMHEALPESLSQAQSMDETAEGTESGLQVYRWLLEVKGKGKPVYLLASHSHLYMEGAYNSEYWRTHGGVLPGWIIGTAGAERIKLPQDAKDAKVAKAHVYGYLLATVADSKTDPVTFEFKELKATDVPGEVVSRFTAAFVQACWDGNPPVQ